MKAEKLQSKEVHPMRILAFETSAKAASVALLEDGRLIGEYYQNCGQTHSRTLMKMAEDLLENCGVKVGELTAVACASGPGSFTGVRIGVAAAKGLAWGAEKPCVGVSTLEAMAQQVNDPIHPYRGQHGSYTELDEQTGGKADAEDKESLLWLFFSVTVKQTAKMEKRRNDEGLTPVFRFDLVVIPGTEQKSYHCQCSKKGKPIVLQKQASQSEKVSQSDGICHPTEPKDPSIVVVAEQIPHTVDEP